MQLQRKWATTGGYRNQLIAVCQKRFFEQFLCSKIVIFGFDIPNVIIKICNLNQHWFCGEIDFQIICRVFRLTLSNSEPDLRTMI